MKNFKLNFWLDLAAFIGFMIAMEPGSTGITVHEWFTLAGVGTLIVHFVLHWDWFIKLTKRYFVKLYHSSRLNYLMAILIFLGFISIIVSGLMISRSVVPSFGLGFDARGAWRQIHSFAANLTLFLVAVHVALRWDWVKTAFNRIVIKPLIKAEKIDPVLVDEDGM